MTTVNETETGTGDDLFSESLELIPTAAWIFEADSRRLIAANRSANGKPEPDLNTIDGYSTSILSFSGRPDVVLVSTSDKSVHNLVRQSVCLNEKLRVTLQSIESIQAQLAYSERVLRTAMNEFNESTTENLQEWLTQA